MTPVAKFDVTVKRDALGRKRWRWNLVGTNGEVVATSETYNSEQAAYNGIAAVRKYAAIAVATSTDDS
jgi:uncharacterized protein YegP (UPF0339 family)